MTFNGNGNGNAPASVLLLEALPELTEFVAHDQAQVARASLRVPAIQIPAGPLTPQQLTASGSDAFAAVVLDGLITRHLDIGGHPALQLHGPGDVVAARPVAQGLLPARDALAAASPSRLAIIDDHFLLAARRWPRLITGFFQHIQDQADRLLVQLVIAEQPRVEERLLALFLHLADRFGTVTRDGVVVSLRLTHQAIGRLIGARRPTVTLALRAL